MNGWRVRDDHSLQRVQADFKQNFVVVHSSSMSQTAGHEL